MASTSVLDLLLTARYVGGPAFTQMSADIDALTAKANGFTKLGSAFNLIGDAMIGAGVAAAAGLGMAVDYAVKYQDAINRITAVTPDLAKHNSELAQLNQQIQSSAVQYAQDPTQIAQGAYYLFSSLGVLGKQPSDLLNNNIINDIAAYSRASGPVGQGGVSFSDAAQILPRIFAASNTPMSEWGGDLGTMTFLENQAHMTQEQLANAGLAFLPTSSLLGINTPDSMTLMAAIASAGRTGAPAGRETMSALTLMLSGKNQQAELNKLGYQNNDFFDPKTGNMLPPDVVMTMLAAKLLPMQPGDRLAAEHQLFGQVGLRAMGPLLQGMDKYNNLISDEKKAGVYHNPEGAQKYMQDLAAKMMNSPKSQLEQLLSSLKVLGIQIGTAVLPPLIQFAHWLTQAVAALTSFVQAHPQLAKTVALAAAPALIGGGLGMKGLGGVFSWLGSPYKEGVHVPTIADHLGGKLFGVAPAMGPLQSGFGGREGGLSGFARSAWGVGQAAPGALLHGAIAAPGAIWGGITSGATAVMDVLDNVALHLMHPLTTAQQLGGALKSLAIGGFGLLKSAILGLPELLGGIVAVGFPIIAVALLIAGAVAIGVLAFTRFRTQTEHLLTVFKDALTPALKLVEAGIYTLVERARAIWEKMAPQIDAAMAKLYPSLERLGPLLQTIGIIIGGVITTVLAIISGLVNGFLTALPPIIGFFSQIANLFADVFAFISDLIHGNWLAAWHDFFHIFADAFSAVGDLLKGVWDFISGFVQGVIGFFQNLADVLVGHSIIPDMITAIVQWFQSLPSQIFSILIGFFNWIQGSFVNLANAALQWGQNFISMLGQGIQSAVGDVLSPVTNLANDISNFLGFNSPPKAGPLSTSDHWMPNMMTMLGTGVTSNTTSVLGPINGLTQGISSSFATMNTNVTASVASTNAAIASLGSGSGSGGGAGNGAGSGAGGGSGSGSGDGVPTGTPTKDITDANAKMQKIIADTNAAMAQQQAQAQGQDLGGPTAADQNKQAWINYLNQQYAKVGLNTIYNQSPDTGPQGATTSAMDQYKQYVSAMGMAQTAFNNGYIVNEKAAMDSWLMVQSTGLTTAERQQNASQEAKIRSNIQYLKSVQDKTGMSQADKIKANQDALNVLLAQDATADKTRLQNYQNYLETLETFTVTDYQKQTMQDDAHNTANEGRQRSALHSQYLTQQAAAAQAQQAKITDYQKQQTIDKTDFTTVEGMTKQHFLNLQTTINAAQAPAAQAGLNVVTGFVNGILNNLFKVDDAGQQLAGRIQGAVTNHLGIHSPSAVFHEFGHMSVEGYRQGVLTHSPSLERLWGAFGPLGSARNGGALHFDSMHVGALHAEGLNQGAQPAPAERPTAWTMGYTRQIQAQRESINARYETHLQDFDFDYRRATQYSS